MIAKPLAIIVGADLLAADELLSGKGDESLLPFRLQRFTDAG